MTVHEILEDGRVRELYKATGGAWGGSNVDEAFVNYFCEIFTKEVIDKVKKEHPTDWVEMMCEFERLKRKVSLDNQTEFIQVTLRPSLQDVYQDIRGNDLNSALESNRAVASGVKLNRRKLKIPKTVIFDMIKKVAKSISSHAIDLLGKQENKNIDFILMVGGFSNSPIVVQEVKDRVSSLSLPVIVPENPELAVVQGAVMFGWKPEMFKSRKSKRTYGIHISPPFREGVDPERLAIYCDNVKRCCNRFSKFVTINEEIEIGQAVKKTYFPAYKDQVSMIITLYESEKVFFTYCDEPGVYELGSITIPMTDTTGGINRKAEATLRFGGTEIVVSGKDLTTGAEVQAVFDFL